MRRFLPLLAALVVALTIPGAHADAPTWTKLAVTGDLPVFVLAPDADARDVIVYLHGHCGDPVAPMKTWPGPLRSRGITISVQADVPCKDKPGRFHWSPDPKAIQRRIDAAVASVAATHGPVSSGPRLLIGYSEGALRAESLAREFPDVYPRIVVGGTPAPTKPTSFARSKAVAQLVGERDVQGPARDGTTALEKAGIRTRLFVLPGVGHGQYGRESPRVMTEALTWLFEE